MELLKDYDCTINYHPSKGNVVADALSRKFTGSLAYMQTIQLPYMVELRELGVELGMHVSGALFASFLLRPILVDQILEAQLEDPYLMSMRRKVEEGKQSDFSIRNDGSLVIGSRLCLLDFCNPYPFQNGNGSTSQWILYSSSLPQLRDMTAFG